MPQASSTHSLAARIARLFRPAPEAQATCKVRRLAGGPIITPSMLPKVDGESINGPSLILVPDWVRNPLGRYYLYFAHHDGAYIRLAYADQLAGPWTVVPGGALHVTDVPAARGHLASPDVIVDGGNRQIRMYFHGQPAHQKGVQRSFAALSCDGLAFTASDRDLGPFYFRVFEHGSGWFAISKGGHLHRSPDGLAPFTAGHDLYPGAKPGPRGKYNEPGNIRHVAVHKSGDHLAIYFTRIGDMPERILRAAVDLRPDWNAWKMGAAEEIARPVFEYEGAELPLRSSHSGAATGPENAIRDPAIFVDGDGLIYLLYAVMGEKGIAIAELTDHAPTETAATA